ncbi:MAG: VWA domain-containing protein [Chitinophagales bacterium]|nr:VWA domain-containing protein [Chitinophagales bacterium]
MIYRFEHPEMFYLFLPFLGGLALIWLYLKWRNRIVQNVFDPELFRSIFPKFSNLNPIVKASTLMVSIFFLILGLTNYQSGEKVDQIRAEGIDIMILLDVSNSMLCEDLSPNRLERAKLLIRKLLDKLSGDRVGLITFTGSAYTQVPLTIDYESLKFMLDMIDPRDYPNQGTSIASAIDESLRVLGDKDIKNKAILILTDGEDNIEADQEAIEKAKKIGIQIIAIGVGTLEGGKIPMNNGFKTDENGQEIITKFNQNMLENLASVGNGKFYHLGKVNHLDDILVQDFEAYEKREYQDVNYSNLNSHFYWFIIISLLALATSFIWNTKRFF